MLDYLSTFIGLFGSISGILIAFLAILFKSSKNWVENSKSEVISEMNSCFKCRIFYEAKTFKDTDDTKWSDIKLEIDNSKFNLEDANLMLATSKNQHKQFSNFNEKDDDGKVGSDAKKAQHIQKYHISDLEDSITTYNSSVRFYDNYPLISGFSIGVPLILTIIFILIAHFKACITINYSTTAIDNTITLLAVLGITFIFFMTLYTLMRIKNIDE